MSVEFEPGQRIRIRDPWGDQHELGRFVRADNSEDAVVTIDARPEAGEQWMRWERVEAVDE